MGRRLLGGLIGSGWATANEMAVSNPWPNCGTCSGSGSPACTSRTVRRGRRRDHRGEARVRCRSGRRRSARPDVAACCRSRRACRPRRSRRRCPPARPSCAPCRTRPRSSARARPRSPAAPRRPMTTSRGPSRSCRPSASSCACPRSSSTRSPACRAPDPAYVFLVAEAMIAAGDAVGLPHDVAMKLAIQTIMGAGRMLAETGDGARSVARRGQSPNGTTVAGLGRARRARRARRVRRRDRSCHRAVKRIGPVRSGPSATTPSRSSATSATKTSSSAW